MALEETKIEPQAVAKLVAALKERAEVLDDGKPGSDTGHELIMIEVLLEFYQTANVGDRSD